MQKLRVKILVGLASTLISLAVLELAVRVIYGVPLLMVQDLRRLQMETNQQASGVFDPALGWTQRTGIVARELNTFDYGIRKNSTKEETISEGGILAVGDSFTAGSEVLDDETWPAHVERLIGRRVFNAGVGGYGTDQAILNAERLLPILKPTVVLIGILAPDDIQRAGYSVYGRPKPYFVRNGDAFEQRNTPVPISADPPADTSRVKQLLSRSMTFNTIFSRLSPDWWFSDVRGQQFERIANNPVAVTCYLLERLQTKLSPAGARGVVVLQHGGWIFARREARSADADSIIQCAGESGYEIVDEYDTLTAIAGRSIEELKLHYVMHDAGATYGHMSGKGNETMARLIAERLGQPAPAARTRTARSERTPGDGINRIAGVNLQHFSAANAVVTAVPEPGPIVGAPVLSVTPTDVNGEHYVAASWSSDQPGLHTFSVFVRQRDAAGVRLQLLDSGPNGVIVDFTYATQLYDVTKIGKASRLDFAADRAADGWLRLSLTAELLAPSGAVILQLRDARGATQFAGGRLELVLQAPMVEGGGMPSAFCGPGTCPAR